MDSKRGNGLRILFRVSPFIFFILILFYLGRLNSTSEVYIDLLTDQINFQIGSEKEYRNNAELISNVRLDSIILLNCDLELKVIDVYDIKGNRLDLGSKLIKISKKLSGENSQVLILKSDRLYLKSLSVASNLKIFVHSGRGAVTISIPHKEETEAEESVQGIIGVGSTFYISGRNILVNGKEYTDYNVLKVQTHKVFPVILFKSKSNTVNIQIFNTLANSETTYVLMENIYAKRLNFATVERARIEDRVKSHIIKGNIQIAGIDFFRKRFFIKEEKLERSDYLSIPEEEEYFIDRILVSSTGLDVSLNNESARQLKMGKRIGLTRSIFPSILEFILKEPSKKMIWVVVSFVLIQLSLIRKLILK